jgi:hypothetical protein
MAKTKRVRRYEMSSIIKKISLPTGNHQTMIRDGRFTVLLGKDGNIYLDGSIKRPKEEAMAIDIQINEIPTSKDTDEVQLYVKVLHHSELIRVRVSKMNFEKSEVEA